MHDVKTVSTDFPGSFPTEILEKIQPAFAVCDKHRENPNIGSVAYETGEEEDEEEEHYMRLFREQIHLFLIEDESMSNLQVL